MYAYHVRLQKGNTIPCDGRRDAQRMKRKCGGEIVSERIPERVGAQIRITVRGER